MTYIVQIFTGNYDAPLYTAESILRRLDEVTATVAVEKLIIGWYPDRELYRTVGAYLRKKGMEMLLWLPVFSETGEFVPMHPAVDVWGHPIKPPTVQEGESFSFCCPSSPQNLAAVKAVYEQHFADVGFDGVFLDRIRTHSFVGGVQGVLSCGCAHCRKAFAAQGVSLKEVADAYAQHKDHLFDAKAVDPDAGITFENTLFERFSAAKAAILANRVAELCRFFREKGMSVGLDLYAPLMSPFVGQSYPLLARHADFIKPMLYRRTDAPAGIGYEYRLLTQSAPGVRGYPPLAWDAAFLKAQLASLSSLPCSVYPGIEINYRADIAPTDEAYVKESLDAVAQSGLAGATLSWDVMLAPDKHLQIAAEM